MRLIFNLMTACFSILSVRSFCFFGKLLVAIVAGAISYFYFKHKLLVAIVAGAISYFYFKHKLGESAIDYWLAFFKNGFVVCYCSVLFLVHLA